MENLVLLVAECSEFPAEAVRLLRDHHDVRLRDIKKFDDLLREVETAQVLWVRLRHRITEQVFDHAPRLRMLVSPTTGLNHIDLDAASERNVEVVSLLGEGDFLKEIRATAEHTVAMTLALIRQLPAAARHVMEGGWDRDLFRGGELFGSTIGVVGYGRLGRIVATYFTAFGATVLATDPNVTIDDVRDGVEMTTLEDLSRRADVVSLHVSLSAESAGFFGAQELGTMKPSAFLINTSRGEILDEKALLDALRSGRLSGAALDVLTGENPEGMDDHPLVRYSARNPNLIITPHIGGNTSQSRSRAEIFLARRVAEWTD